MSNGLEKAIGVVGRRGGKEHLRLTVEIDSLDQYRRGITA